MSRDLTIRLLGRPQVTVDKRTGFSKLSRRYVVQGPRATLAGIEDSNNPLFLAAGTADEEFTDYYLVDQSLAPANGTLEKAYLVREYLQLSSSAVTEAFQQSNDLIRVRKRFAVIRSANATLGYGDNWSKHPNQATTYAQDPWEYAPSWVANATPGSRNYTVTNADDDTQHGFTEAPQIDGQNLGAYISSHASTGDWLKGYAVMSQAGSGLDIWTVEWVTHAPPYWALGTGRGNRSVTKSAAVLSFSKYGVVTSDSIASSGTVNYATRTMRYNFFAKGSSIPTNLAKIGGGSSSVNFKPSVTFDLVIKDTEGRVSYIKETRSGAVWNGPQTLTLTTVGGDDVDIATTAGRVMTFDWSTTKEQVTDPLPSGTSGPPSPAKDVEGNDVFDWVPSKLIEFRGVLITSIQGNISWTTHRDSYSWSSSSGTFDRVGTQITPIFSHGSEKIWKVAITYVGG